MKTIFLLFIALTATSIAGPPKPVPTTRYTRLWKDSPFTSKPPPEGPKEEANPLEDYALGGVSPVTGGYRVTLLNRKNPEERIILPDNPDFKILAVQYATGRPLGTTVRVSTGSKTGTVSFDEKLLTLKTAPPPQAQPQGQPNGVPGAPGQPPQQPPVPGMEAPRAPRPRVVPPAGQQGANPPTANQGGAVLPPGAAPQQQQLQQRGGQRIQRR